MTNDSPKMLGTLIIIVMKAKNLPNLVKIGKQNPFTTVTYGGIKKKTSTIDRGGQAPEWDEEFRFEIPEDMEGLDLIPDGAAVNKLGGVLPLTSPTSPSGSGAGTNEGVGVVGKIKIPPPTIQKLSVGLKHFRLACYADDPKDPKMIGEIMIELEPIIKKGTSDQWWELQKKARYAGEIFLEMTFYSNAEPPVATLKKKKSRLPTSVSYGGPGGRVDDERAELDDFGGVDQWERDERIGGVSSRASHLSAINSSNDFASDYPDADLAPLARSMSSLSMGNSLPPIPQHYAYDQPQYQQQQQQQQPSYEQHYDQYALPPPPPPPPVQNEPYYEDRRASYSFQPPPQPPRSPMHYSQQQQQPEMIHGDRRSSYSHVQPLPEPPHNNRRISYTSSPAPLPSVPVYSQQPVPQPSEFERLAEAHYANEAYQNNQAYPSVPLGQQPQYVSHDQWQQGPAPPPTQSYQAPPPLPQPPVHPQWSSYQQQQAHYGGFTPPPPAPLAVEAFTPPPPPPPALSSSIGYYQRGPPPPLPQPPLPPPTPSQIGYYQPPPTQSQLQSHPLPHPNPPPPRFPTEPPRNHPYPSSQQAYIPPAIPPAGSWSNSNNNGPPILAPQAIITRPNSGLSISQGASSYHYSQQEAPPPQQESVHYQQQQYSQQSPQQQQPHPSYYQNPPPLPPQQQPQHYHSYPQGQAPLPPPPPPQQQHSQHQQQQSTDYLSSYNPYGN